MIYTVGDIVLAANIGRELHNLVIDYLQDYCKYANGANNIKYVSNQIKFVTIHGVAGTPEVPILKVSVCTKVDHVSYDSFVEEDPPADYEGGFGQRYGRYETSGYTDKTYSEITIPMSLLLDPKPLRIEKLTKINQNWITKLEEDRRQNEITRLKKELARLGA